MAGDSAGVTLAGYDELISGSADLFERIGKSSSDEFEREAAHQAGIISARMPRDSGLLAGSITYAQEGDTAYVGLPLKENVPYAGWIEFGGIREGGRNSSAERPYYPQGRYIFPVATADAPNLEQVGTNVSEREIARYPWKTPR